MHTFWECPGVLSFWRQVANTLSHVLEIPIPCLPHVLLLNDDSMLRIPYPNKKVFFAGITAAKKMLISRWNPPHTLLRSKWLYSFLNVLNLELSIARTNGAKKKSIDALVQAIETVKHIDNCSS